MAKDKTDIDIPAPTGVSMIKIKKGDTVYPIKLYSTEAETGTPVDGGVTDTLKLRMGDTTYYARMTTNIRSDVAGGYTPLRYKSSSGNVYQVTQKGEFSITVPASSNQTVCVSANGQTYKGANTLWFAEGTEWSAYVEVDSSYIAGSLNVTGGTLNSTVNLSVTPATPSGSVIPSGSATYVCPTTVEIGTTNIGSFTVPNYITVLHVAGTTPYGANNTYNIKVTPGKAYPITGGCHRYKSGANYRYAYSVKFNDLEISKKYSDNAYMEISWSPTINTYTTDHDFS